MIVTYIIIYFLMFFFFFLYGRFVKNGNYSTYMYSILPIIIFFTTIEGLRFNRGIDYIAYARHYDYPATITHTQDIGFDILNKSLQFIGLDSVGSFLVYAFITIISVSILLKTFPEIWNVSFILMLIALILPSEQMIRQFIAISLLYASIGLYLQERKKTAFVIMLIALSIHYSSVIFIAMIIATILYKKLLPIKITLPVFVILCNFLPADVVLGPIGDIINTYMAMDESSSYASYVDRSDDFLNANASNEMFQRSIATTIINMVFILALFTEGYYLVKRNGTTKYRIIYNLVVIGTIFFEFFHTFELFKRMFMPASLLWFIVASLILCNKKILKFGVSYYVVLFYTLAQGARFIFMPGEEMYYFIWDK